MRRTFTRPVRRATIAAVAGLVLVAAACTRPPSTAQAWERARAVGPQQLVVSFVGPPPMKGPYDPCGVEYTARVSESGERVVITVHGRGYQPPFPAACTAIAAFREVPVALQSPLAGRTLIDGATGEARPLTGG